MRWLVYVWDNHKGHTGIRFEKIKNELSGLTVSFGEGQRAPLQPFVEQSQENINYSNYWAINIRFKFGGCFKGNF